MSQSNLSHINNSTPSPRLLPVLQKLKSAYVFWSEYHKILPKTQRYSLGLRINDLFIQAIEATVTASFLPKTEKQPYVRLAIKKTDTLNILLLILWETKSLDNKKYIAISEKINEIGRMLGGWNGQLTKQNSPRK